MMRSLFSGVAGLANHQTRMDVIGNNIANVNTVGYKAGRATFQDMLSQTLQGASSAGTNTGGTNPMQVGLGSGVASIDTMFTDGSTQSTGKQTDLAISGQGFFILKDGSNQFYSRAGDFDFDSLGNMVVPGSGYQVMGWNGTNGVINTTGATAPIVIPVGTSMPAKASTSITYENNLNADAAVGDAVSASISVYDSLGGAHKVPVVFTKSADNTWDVSFASGATSTTIDGATFDISSATTSLVFDDTTGQLSTGTAGIDVTGSFSNGGTMGNLTLTVSGLTQYSGTSTLAATDTDGYAAGTLQKKTIDSTGTIVGTFSNGETQNLAQIALAVFNNPGGLTKVGDTLFEKSNNSGEPQVGTVGTGGRGGVTASALEMSNVDLSQEFSNMIITQRGFQANSKIITTSDEMLEILANLKR